MTTDQQTYVIVGAALAGAKAAETLRDEGFDGTIVLIGEEAERPYDRPPLSKDYLMGKAGRVARGRQSCPRRMNVNVSDVTGPIQALVRSQRPVDPASLSDPGVPLEQLI